MADVVLADLVAVVQTEHGWIPKQHMEILSDTTKFMGEAASLSYYASSLVSISNNLIVELFRINNAARKKAGKEQFTEYPVIVDVIDILPFEYEVIYGVFVYGLAYWLFVQDEEYMKANAMLMQFNQAKKNFAPCLYEPVESIV